MLALENPRLAGYMLTGNRSKFLKTDGRVAWLHYCPKVHWTLHTMNQCYKKIPNLYRGKIHFVDPNTWQTYPHGTMQNCSDRITNLFQLDTDHEDTWYSLTPGIVHQDQTAILGPQDISPIVFHSFTEWQDAGMHTRNELRGFQDSILINAASRTALKKLAKSYSILYKAKRNRRLSLLHSNNCVLCQYNDLTRIHQRKFLGYVWTCCLCTRTLSKIHFSVFVRKTYYWLCSHNNAIHGNLQNDWLYCRV